MVTMAKKKLIKEKIGQLSIILSGILYIIIALDYLDKKNYWLFVGIGIVGITNLLILKFRKTVSNMSEELANGLNFIAAGLIFINLYQQNGRYMLWGGITCAYLIVTIMFLVKRKRATTTNIGHLADRGKYENDSNK
jgi:hypothetical protein